MTTPTTPIEQVFSILEIQTNYLSNIVNSFEYATNEQKTELLNPINKVNSLLQEVVVKVKNLPTTKPVKPSTSIFQDLTNWYYGKNQ